MQTRSPRPFRSRTNTILDSKCRVLIASLCALLVVGCASAQAPPPRSVGPLSPPEDGYVSIGVPNVPLPDPAQRVPISLEAMLAYADRHAPSLLVARERVGLGDAAIAGAEPLLPDNPNVSVAVGPALNSDQNHVDFQASVSQRIEVAGERGLRLEAAERARDRLRAELDEARWETHRDVHATFHRALVARERLEAAERLLAFQERLLEIAQARLRAGDVSPLQVRLAEGELSQARVARIAAAQEYSRVRLQLGALSGWPAGAPPEPAGVLDEPRDPPDGQTLIEAARSHQPRLRTLQAARDEADARSRSAARDAWPEPSIGVQVSRENYIRNPPETQVLGVLSVPVPLFQRNQGARATALAEARIADAEQEAFGLQLLNLIEQNRAAVTGAASRLRTYGGEILPTFEENLRLLQRAFELGEIDILQVSVAREQFLRTQTDALDAYLEYFQAVADLEASIGTDLWPDERHESTLDAEDQP